MAYNNGGDVKTMSARFVERTNREGNKSKYTSFH